MAGVSGDPRYVDVSTKRDDAHKSNQTIRVLILRLPCSTFQPIDTAADITACESPCQSMRSAIFLRFR